MLFEEVEHDMKSRVQSAMPKMKVFMSDESGATAIEYAFIAAGVALAIAGAVTALGGSLIPIYQQIEAIFV